MGGAGMKSAVAMAAMGGAAASAGPGFSGLAAFFAPDDKQASGPVGQQGDEAGCDADAEHVLGKSDQTVRACGGIGIDAGDGPDRAAHHGQQARGENAQDRAFLTASQPLFPLGGARFAGLAPMVVMGRTPPVRRGRLALGWAQCGAARLSRCVGWGVCVNRVHSG